jgi:hypothetical protein
MKPPFFLFILAATAHAVDFTRDVRPVLAQQCFTCHGMDDHGRKGKLRLDLSESAYGKGKSGEIAIIPGKPDASEVVKRILSTDEDEVMPPPHTKKVLSEKDKATLKAWIAEGAKWPDGIALRYKSPEELKALADLQAKLPTLKRLEILPEKFSLETKRDSHRVIVFATFQDATTKDVSGLCDLKVVNPKIASLSGLDLKPVADAGATELTATLGGQTVKAQIQVKGGQQDRAISFRLDCMPVFMRGGCNQGGCHGAARGKDGFRTSLFGMDPAGDFIRITREMPGRRLNLAIPEESALIEKAVGAVPHSGNQCFEPDSSYNKTLIEWISSGAPVDKPDVAKCTGIEVYPKQIVIEGKNATQQITVRATYSDGSTGAKTYVTTCALGAPSRTV